MILNFHKWTIIAGPCSAESENQIIKSAISLKKYGINIMRAGIWKPRTDPNSWQGSGDKAVKWLLEARKKTGILIATEVKDTRTLKIALENHFDLVWIGSRNGQNYSLLEETGIYTKKSKIPVLLKRAMGASLKEWLGASKYITKSNKQVILCERGIRGFSPDTRNILDLQTAYLAKLESKLPVIIDVSHAAGRRDLILPMARAVKAAGFNGLMVEVHPNPEKAKTDGLQQINNRIFAQLLQSLDSISVK